MFNRTLVINELIDNDFDTIMNSDYGPELLREYLASGFIGYNNMTDEQLVAEMNERDISYLYSELTTEE
jgi:hypothetical protein